MGFITDAIGGFLGANSQAHNAQKSVSDYQNAVQWSDESAKNALANSTAAFQPIYNTGVNALGNASAMLQPGYNFQSSDPSYAWRLGQGLDAVQGSAAARGLLNSGGTMKALNNYAQGAASQEFQNQFARQNSLAGYAQPAASGIATANANYADNRLKAFFAGADGMAGGRTAQGQATAAEFGAGSNIISSVGKKFFGF